MFSCFIFNILKHPKLGCNGFVHFCTEEICSKFPHICNKYKTLLILHHPRLLHRLSNPFKFAVVTSQRHMTVGFHSSLSAQASLRQNALIGCHIAYLSKYIQLSKVIAESIIGTQVLTCTANRRFLRLDFSNFLATPSSCSFCKINQGSVRSS